jgi:hypothetical protein
MRHITLIITALALAVAAPAVAGKGGVPNGGTGNPNTAGGGTGNGGGGKDTSSLALVVLDADDGGANYGEQITFEVSTTATDQPFVSARCYQEGALVYSASAGFFDGYTWPDTQVFTLRSNAWTGGAADCSATLEYWDGRRFRELAALSFSVYA